MPMDANNMKWPYPFSMLTMSTQVTRNALRPGVAAMVAGVDGRIQGAIVPFPGMDRHSCGRLLTDQDADEIGRYEPETAGDILPFNIVTTSGQHVGGWVVLWEGTIYLWWKNQVGNWASYIVGEGMGLWVVSAGKFLYVGADGQRGWVLSLTESDLWERYPMGATVRVPPVPTITQASSTSSYLKKDGAYLLAYRYRNTTRGYSSELSEIQEVTMTATGYAHAPLQLPKEYDAIELYRSVNGGGELFLENVVTRLENASTTVTSNIAKSKALTPYVEPIDTDVDTWVRDGEVLCTAQFDGKMWIGGTFLTVGETRKPFLVAYDLSAKTWSQPIVVTGPVYALTTVTFGSTTYLVVGGCFTQARVAGGPYQDCTSLVMYEAGASSLDCCTLLETTQPGVQYPDLTPRVHALTVWDSKLWVGGWFTAKVKAYPSEEWTYHLVALSDLNSASAIAFRWQPSVEKFYPNEVTPAKLAGSVRNLLATASGLFVAGDFSWTMVHDTVAAPYSLKYTEVPSLVKLSLSSSRVIPTNIGGPELTKDHLVPIRAMASTPVHLIIGGDFTRVYSAAAGAYVAYTKNIATYDLSAGTWSTIGTGGDPETEYISSIAVNFTATPNVILVGGSFSKMGGVANRNVAVWVPGTPGAWSAETYNFNGPVTAIEVVTPATPTYYFVGAFSTTAATTIANAVVWGASPAVDGVTDGLPDGALAASTMYDATWEATGSPPATSVATCYRDAIFMSDDIRGAAGSDLVFSSPHRYDLENFPYACKYSMPHTGEQLVSYVQTSNALFALTTQGAIRIQKNGSEVTITPIDTGWGIVGRHAAVAVGGSIVAVTRHGVVLWDTVSGQTSFVGALQGLFTDFDWQTYSPDFRLAFDEALGAVFIVSPTLRLTFVYWTATNAVTCLYNTPWVACCSGADPIEGGHQRAFFLTSSRYIVCPRLVASSARTIGGATISHRMSLSGREAWGLIKGYGLGKPSAGVFADSIRLYLSSAVPSSMGAWADKLFVGSRIYLGYPDADGGWGASNTYDALELGTESPILTGGNPILSRVLPATADTYPRWAEIVEQGESASGYFFTLKIPGLATTAHTTGYLRRRASKTSTTLTSFASYGAKVRAVAVSPDGTKVAVGTTDNTVTIWTLSTGALVATLTGPTGDVLSVAFSPDSTKVVAGSADNKAYVWLASGGAATLTMTGHTGDINAVAWASAGILLGSADNTATLRSATDGTVIQTFTGHTGAVNAVAFNSGATKVATASDDNTAKLWDVTGGTVDQTLTGHTGDVTGICYATDSYVLTASRDDTLKKWKVSDGSLSATYTGHRDDVLSVAYESGGSFVSGSEDGTIKVWTGGVCVTTIDGHVEEYVNSVAISPDGVTVVSGSNDGTARTWVLATGAEAKIMDPTYTAHSTAYPFFVDPVVVHWIGWPLGEWQFGEALVSQFQRRLMTGGLVHFDSPLTSANLANATTEQVAELQAWTAEQAVPLSSAGAQLVQLTVGHGTGYPHPERMYGVFGTNTMSGGILCPGLLLIPTNEGFQLSGLQVSGKLAEGDSYP